MIYRVDKKYQKAGEFPDKVTKAPVAYDNTFFCLAPYDEKGDLISSPIFAKIKTKNLRDDIQEGDYVEVYNNEYKVPSMVVLVRKGDSEQ